jgi:hypothetical protein
MNNGTFPIRWGVRDGPQTDRVTAAGTCWSFSDSRKTAYACALGFRGRLAPREAHERVSDFLPLAATLIHLKSQLFLRQAKEEEPDRQARADVIFHNYCD